jgi:hypothetical protein
MLHKVDQLLHGKLANEEGVVFRDLLVVRIVADLRRKLLVLDGFLVVLYQLELLVFKA